jgi:hypothetical protein
MDVTVTNAERELGWGAALLALEALRDTLAPTN